MLNIEILCILNILLTYNLYRDLNLYIQMLYTKIIMDISKFYDCDYCKINTDDNDIQVDYESKLIKFLSILT